METPQKGTPAGGGIGGPREPIVDKIQSVKDEVVFTAATLDQVQATLIESFQKNNKAKKGKKEEGSTSIFGAAGSTLGAAGSVLKGKITQGFSKEKQLDQVKVWESPTTLGWLETAEKERLQQRGPETDVLMVWALVFQMPDDIDHTTELKPRGKRVAGVIPFDAIRPRVIIQRVEGCVRHLDQHLTWPRLGNI